VLFLIMSEARCDSSAHSCNSSVRLAIAIATTRTEQAGENFAQRLSVIANRLPASARGLKQMSAVALLNYIDASQVRDL
jgi:hypothetical protein